MPSPRKTERLRPEFETPADPAATTTRADEPRLVPPPIPIVFDGCSGIFHPSTGTTGVVLCGAWGYEDLVIRSSWRHFAAMLAGAGFPCLRFDYPASGNSLGEPSEVGLADWVAAARHACDLLLNYGVQDIVIIGQSVGTIVACAAALDRAHIAGLVLLAPTTGRRYLRETAHWSAMIAGVEGFDRPASGLSIAGFAFPPRLSADLKAGPAAEWKEAPAPWALLVEAPGQADTALAAKFTALGTTVEHLPFEGVDRLLSGPTTSETPHATFAAIVAALAARLPSRGLPGPAHEIATLFPPKLAGRGFTEEAVTFGPDRRLFGILCVPEGARGDRIVLFLTTGRNPHTGWRRMGVDHARALAADGIASLRFDIGGAGESEGSPERPQPVLYSDVHVPDVQAAIDVARERGFRSITVVGVCSGAYLGLLAAVADSRVCGLVAVNLPRFAWAATESIAAAMAYSNRPADLRVTRLLHRDTLMLIARGKLDPRPAAIFRLKAIGRRWSLKLAPLLGRLSPAWPVYAEACRRLRVLRDHRTPVTLGYSAADQGYQEVQLLFGRAGHRLRAYGTMSIEIVEGADHNLSQDHACAWLLERIKDGVRVARTAE